MKKTCIYLVLLFIVQTTMAQQVKINRLHNNKAIITAAMFEQAGALPQDGENINSPSVVRLPEWLPREDRVAPEANYYLYFAHHGGKYIRMAWATDIEGDWTLYNVSKDTPLGSKGVLSLYTETPEGYNEELHITDRILINGHIASPFVIVDDEAKQFILYFHAGSTYVDKAEKRLFPQRTFVALSGDGVHFTEEPFQPAVLGASYFVPFESKGQWYAFSNTGDFCSAPTGGNIWVAPEDSDPSIDLWTPRRCILDELFDKYSKEHTIVVEPRMMPRHVGIYIEGEKMHLLCSAKSDTPERLYYTTFDTSDTNCDNWSATDLQLVMSAETEWEGGNLAPQLSVNGKAPGMLNDVRDPYIFKDTDGKLYLFYAGGGEYALGIAAIEFVNN